MERAAPMRANENTSTPISARSRKPTLVLVSIESRSTRVSSRVRLGVLPRFTTSFGPRTELAGFHRQHLAGHEPIEEHAHGSEVLLDAGLGEHAAAVLDIRGDHGRVD